MSADRLGIPITPTASKIGSLRRLAIAPGDRISWETPPAGNQHEAGEGQADADPEGWHEMIYVTEGGLRPVTEGRAGDSGRGLRHFSSAQVYSYHNEGACLLRFLRNVVKWDHK